jgi:hypothetical protein
VGKYEPLSRYLKSHPDDSWSASFEEIEEKMGFPLPPSAFNYPAWWSNQKDGKHSQTAGWKDAGWETRAVDLARRRVRFERVSRHGRANGAGPKAPDLWRQASELSGIDDRERLIEAGLLALIQREAAQRLARLGGTMPDLVVPERERPLT